jgi:hypothetical protein
VLRQSKFETEQAMPATATDTNISVSWLDPFVSSLVPLSGATWIIDLIWKNEVNPALPQAGGLYLIENSAGVCIYAGKATNTRSRFATRSEPLREFRLLSNGNPLSTYKVRIANISPWTYGPDGNYLDVAETWLIRAITIYQKTTPSRILQNINKIDPFKPKSTITITNKSITQIKNNKVDNRPTYIPKDTYICPANKDY